MNALMFTTKGTRISAALLFLTLGALAQQQAFESPAGTKYLLYTPPGYNSSTSTFPLLLSLHSKGEVGNDLSELTINNPEQMPCRLIYLNKWPQNLPFIVLTPQLKPDPNDPNPNDPSVQWSAEYIDEVVNYVISNYRVDLNRIYVTGISRGGTGTWTYTTAHPEKVAAILALSGRSNVPMACRIKDIPIWAFHGDNDEVVAPSNSINMINAIKACQPPGIYKPRLNILNARDHNGWNEVYNGSSGYKVFEWLLQYRKNDISNKKPYVNAGPDLRFQLRNEPINILADIFDFDGNIINVRWNQTAGVPLTLSDTGSEYLKISDLKTGTFEFEITVTDDKGAQNSDKVAVEITDASVLPVITQLILMNGYTNAEIGNLAEGQVINKTTLGLTEINIKAIASSGTASVMFNVNTDQNTRTLNAGPHLIKIQTTTPEWRINNGVYLIRATPYAATNASGLPGVSLSYKITITDGVVSGSCPGTGKIRQEVWTGVSGTLISSIPVNSVPNSTTDLTIFEGPANIGDNYGRRIRGYVCAPVSGNYTFWISSNDKSELWLSTDENPGNKKLVASVSQYTDPRQWTKYASQQSLAISLVANRKYYIEALQKEGTGSDHIAVGWQLPGGTLERPIPGMRLIPFQDSGGIINPVITITSPTAGQSFPAPATVNIAANAFISTGSITKVEFYNGTSKLGEDTTAPYTFTWGNVSAGNYTLISKALGSTGGTATASVNITVTAATSCAGTGKISREIWTGIQNNVVGAIPVNLPPNGTSELTIFEDPTNVGDNYGTRVSGYLCVPATGAYTFWISSNDNSELWLSTDDNPLNKRRIAYVSGYTDPRQWTKYASQQSAPVNLVAAGKYYIEALHKEGVGSDHMAVGWQLPGGTQERPIPGTRLSPFVVGSASMSVAEMGNASMVYEASNPELNIFPNPTISGMTALTISGDQEIEEPTQTTIEIIRMTGDVIYSQKNFCEQNCRRGLININKELPAGVYLIKVVRNGKQLSKRLLVK